MSLQTCFGMFGVEFCSIIRGFSEIIFDKDLEQKRRIINEVFCR